jgi:hypothetical protein
VGERKSFKNFVHGIISCFRQMVIGIVICPIPILQTVTTYKLPGPMLLFSFDPMEEQITQLKDCET